MAYHHGDARTALVRAAEEMLESEGAAGLSLRQVAERAKLSRQAPYNHFADKEALLAELVRDGFSQLGRLLKADADPKTAPKDRLADAAAVYISFGQAKPALFRLMFGKELVDLSRHAPAREAAAAAFAELSTIVATMAPPAATKDVSLVAWSLVHGYTALCIETGLEDEGMRRKRAQLFAHTVEALARSGTAHSSK